MKALLPYLILLLPFSFFSCDNEKPFEEGDLKPKQNFCDSTGILKKDLYAEIRLFGGGGSDWQIIIEDTIRIAEVFNEWSLFPCKKIPDSLRLNGLPLTVSYLDKSKRLADGELIRSAEIVTVKRINDFPNEDPRNGKNMSTLYVTDKDGENLYFEKELIFRNSVEWNQFLSAYPGASASQKVDFSKFMLLAQVAPHGGCGWFYRRSFTQTGPHEFVYKVRAEIYGGCQAGQRTYHWVMVPKILPEDTVIFKFDPVFHYWPS